MPIMFNKYEVYTTTASIYCYKDSNVLKNKAGIRDGDTLRAMENEIVAVKQYELLLSPIAGRFTKSHLYRIHRFLFEDVYVFAGHTRKEQIAKGTTTFYPPASIDKELNKIFKFIADNHQLTDFMNNDLLDAIAFVMAELNVIHPFREGNGRAIREFVRLLALHNGLRIDWSNVKYTDILDASIASVDDHTKLIPILETVSVNHH